MHTFFDTYTDFSMFVRIRLLYLIISLLGAQQIGVAQTSIGLLFDADGASLEGYYDPLLYSPSTVLTIDHPLDDFEKGVIYDNEGIRHQGFIEYKNKKVQYKPFVDAFHEVMRPAKVTSMTIGVDSFLVIRNFRFKGKIRKGPEFAKFVASFDGMLFAAYYRFSSSGILEEAEGPVKTHYLIKPDTASIWHAFDQNSDSFQQQLRAYFNRYQWIAPGIQEGSYKREDLGNIIRLAEYESKAINGLPIYLNAQWQEVRSVYQATYTARARKVVDSLINITYYQDSLKLYDVAYTSVFPREKTGWAEAYFANGQVRERIRYQDSYVEEFQAFDQQNNLLTHYRQKRIPDFKRGINEIERTYVQVSGDEASYTLDPAKTRTVVRYDSVSDLERTFVYQGQALTHCYAEINSLRVYQHVDRNNPIKVKELQGRLDRLVKDRHYRDAVRDNAQGMILVYLEVYANGKVRSYRILNTLHPDLDNAISRFLEKTFPKGKAQHASFPKYKVDGAPVLWSFVVPIHFNINGFYRDKYYYHDPFFLRDPIYNPSLIGTGGFRY